MSEDDEFELIKRRLYRRIMREALRPEPSVLDKPIDLTPENFNKIISENAVVLVDFWAEWCAPCRIMHPIIEALARKYAGKLVVGRLNVDYYPQIAAKFSVMGIPTLILFYRGKPVQRIVGVTSMMRLESIIRQFID